MTCLPGRYTPGPRPPEERAERASGRSGEPCCAAWSSSFASSGAPRRARHTTVRRGWHLRDERVSAPRMCRSHLQHPRWHDQRAVNSPTPAKASGETLPSAPSVDASQTPSCLRSTPLARAPFRRIVRRILVRYVRRPAVPESGVPRCRRLSLANPACAPRRLVGMRKEVTSRSGKTYLASTGQNAVTSVQRMFAAG